MQNAPASATPIARPMRPRPRPSGRRGPAGRKPRAGVRPSAAAEGPATARRNSSEMQPAGQRRRRRRPVAAAGQPNQNHREPPAWAALVVLILSLPVAASATSTTSPATVRLAEDGAASWPPTTWPKLDTHEHFGTIAQQDEGSPGAGEPRPATVNFAQNLSSSGTTQQHRRRGAANAAAEVAKVADKSAARAPAATSPAPFQPRRGGPAELATFVTDRAAGAPPRTSISRRWAPVAAAAGPSEQSQRQQALQAAQEDRRQANRLNTELCRNFSIGLQHDKGGVFTSPNYPNPYPVDLTCTRLIEAPLGHFIVVEFRDQFNIEEAGDDCDNDKIEIRDGRFGYSKVLARYCGNKFPPEVRSTNEAMWLRFISDGSISHNGFKAVYRFERQKNVKPNPPFECRFNVTSMPTLPSVNGTENRTGIHSGIIRNTDVPEKLVNYTREYNVSLECIWNITVTPGWKIYLTFSNYEISKPNDCESNFIEIYEENLTEENQTVKFCGTRTEPQQSRSNVFNIRHHAIPAAQGSRFEMIYTAFRDKGPTGCDSMEFDCDDGTCIHDSLKCDGIINCKYRYDEASDPGPCQSNGDAPPFFETEHMVIILIVFLTLVGGMCASIVISCWGKIQERRRRKLEYHIRKSREASMEGQMNKVDQLYSQSSDGDNNNNNSASNNNPGGNGAAVASRPTLKQRSLAKLMMSQGNGARRQLTADSLDVSLGLDQNALDAQRLLAVDRQASGAAGAVAHPFRHPMLGQMMISSDSFTASGHQLLAGGGGGPVGASNSSLDAKGLDGLQHLRAHPIYGQAQQQQPAPPATGPDVFVLEKSNQNSQKSFLASLAAAAGQPAGAAGPRDLAFAQDLQQQQQQQQQQLLNSTLIKNQMARQQQLIRGQSVQQQPPAPGQQTLPINLAKYNMVQQQQRAAAMQGRPAAPPTSLGASQAALRGPSYGQRALTLSAMHRPAAAGGAAGAHLQPLYGPYGAGQRGAIGQNSQLSTSISCCNGLGDCLASETPLLGDLVSRVQLSSGEQARVLQLLQQQQQQADVRSLSAAGGGLATMPRSMSAYQLSKAQQLRQHQHQQQVHQHQLQELYEQQQRLARQQQQRQAAGGANQRPMSYKSMSDAGHASKHQPPNHSISYPHACKVGVHALDPRALAAESPSLPPPPPPPSLGARAAAAAGGAQLLQQQQQQDVKRAAFKVSRLDSSQLTGDTELPDSELAQQQQQSTGLHIGSMQFDDPSTESTDATFGMLMNSLGNASAGLQNQHGLRLQRQQSSSAGSQQIQQQQTPLLLNQGCLVKSLPLQQQQQLVTHLGGCSLVQRGRAGSGNQQLYVCDCGALAAHSLQQQQQALCQQQQQHQFLADQSNDFDLDSDEALADRQAQLGLAADGRLLNGPLYGAQRYSRFRQQSSELTGDYDDDGLVDDDDDDEDADDDVEQDDDQDDDDGDGDEMDDGAELNDESTNGRLANGQQFVAVNGLARATRNAETLKEAPALKKRNLSGSHTSISCKSCTCGSQTQLNAAAGNYNEPGGAAELAKGSSGNSSSDNTNRPNSSKAALKIYNDSTSAATSDQGANLDNNCDTKPNAQQAQQLN